MARHIASHRVTVTERDTVPRASRHMRPSLEGAVYVTRDAGEGREGRKTPHQPLARVYSRDRQIINAAVAVRLTRQGRHSTSTTDRQPCQCWRACQPPSKALAITACADTVQTRESAPRDNAAFMGVSGIRPHDGKSREGVFARDVAASFTVYLLEEREGQAIGATEALSNGIARMFEIQPEKDRGGVGVAGRSVARPIIDVNPVFRGLFRRKTGLPKSARLSPRKSRSAKTQPCPSIASRVMSATRGAVQSQNAPAASAESWGMSP